jgi:PilZ domain
VVAGRFHDSAGGRPAIRIGARVHVAYAGARREPTFTATIRQMSYDFVRLDLYSLPNYRLPPQPGEPVILIAQDGGEMKAFDAAVIGVEGTPPALVLTTPIEARRTERRQHPRVPADLPLYAVSWLARSRGAQPLGYAQLVDISIGGLRLSTWDAPDEGADIHLQLDLTGRDPDDVVDVAGQIVAVRSAPNEENLFHVSLTYTELDPVAFEAIGDFVNRALREELRRAS